MSDLYLHLENSVLDEPKYVTTNGHCFRNEKERTGLTQW